jgi:hypothetical protein
MKAKNINKLLGNINQDEVYLQQLFGYYRECYLQDKSLQLFVKTSPRIPDEYREHSYIGLCDRTVGLLLPKTKTLDGGAIRGSLKQIGLFLPTGGELFRGCIVFTKRNNNKQILSAIGYRYGARIRPWQLPVIQWTKPELDNYINQGMKLVEEVTYGKA